MQRIREWMDQNPDGAKELRRQNRSYVFFREVQLSDKDEAVGAQGVPLTPGRSIAVDKSLHVYGTPFLSKANCRSSHGGVEDAVPPADDRAGHGIGDNRPARADLYFGAGSDAGRVSGRLRHNMRFVILVPKSLDPVARGRKMPLPDARPSEKIAKLFPQVHPLQDQQRTRRTARNRRRLPAAASQRMPRPRKARRTPRPRLISRSHRGKYPGQMARETRTAAGSAAGTIKARSVSWTSPPLSRSIIVAADESGQILPTSIPRIAGAAAPQAQPERGRACAVGECRETDQTAAQETSRRKAPVRDRTPKR